MEYDTSDSTIVDLISNCFVLCTNIKVYLSRILIKENLTPPGG